MIDDIRIHIPIRIVVGGVGIVFVVAPNGVLHELRQIARRLLNDIGRKDIRLRVDIGGVKPELYAMARNVVVVLMVIGLLYNVPTVALGALPSSV